METPCVIPIPKRRITHMKLLQCSRHNKTADEEKYTLFLTWNKISSIRLLNVLACMKIPDREIAAFLWSSESPSEVVMLSTW